MSHFKNSLRLNHRPPSRMEEKWLPASANQLLDWVKPILNIFQPLDKSHINQERYPLSVLQGFTFFFHISFTSLTPCFCFKRTMSFEFPLPLPSKNPPIFGAQVTPNPGDLVLSFGCAYPANRPTTNRGKRFRNREWTLWKKRPNEKPLRIS